MKKWLTAFYCCMMTTASLKAQQLTRAEYFFNTDPGFGNGMAIAFSQSDSIQVNTNITIPNTLPAGVNILFVRVANNSGVWGFPEPTLLWINSGSQNITAAEYFFDTDPGTGLATPFSISPEDDSISITQSITIPALSLGGHKLYVRTRNTDGVWSFPEVHPINICTSYGPVADFNYYINGPEVYFTDSSTQAVTRTWNFGDNTGTVATVNPYHLFQQGNTYHVKLKTANSCGVDSIIKSISIFGVQNISPSKSAATGLYIGYVKGVGFKPGAKARWLKDNSIELVADTTVFIDSTLLKVIFQNAGEVLGSYDLLVDVPGSSEQRMVNAIIMEATIEYDIWVNILARRELLTNRWTTIKLVYGNNSNQAALGVPVIVELPGSVEARLLTPTNDTTMQQELIDATPDHFFLVTDSLTNESIRLGHFMIPYLEAGASGELIFEIKTASLAEIPVTISAGLPYYSDTAYNFMGRLGRPNSPPAFCDPPKCVKCALDLAGFAPGLGCAIGIYKMGCAEINMITSKDKSGRVVDFIGQLGATLLSCLPVANTVSAAIQAAAKAASKLRKANNTASDCGGCYMPPGLDRFFPRGSWDPNVKAGPLGYNTAQYTRWQDPFNYLIHFENKDSATAPASEVVIVDYLDSLKFDIGTLRFTGFGFADTSFSFNFPGNFVQQDVDLRPGKNAILRLSARIDSVNKLVVSFITFDPSTMRLTNDFTQGFLNPNNNGTEGLGYVSFQVKDKPTLPTGTIINNLATVVFDNNPPIITPVWSNGIDKEKPGSNVLPITDKINDSTYTVKWTGSDAHAGVRHYTIFVSTNDSAYMPYIVTDSLQVKFTGRLNSTYKFYSRAEDFVSNMEDHASTADQQITMLPTPLPVTLVEFRAFIQNKKTVLKWITSYEQYNRGFEIQRSGDGISFNRVGWVNGLGNSVSEHTYSFIDSVPLTGKNFYRLKQIDFDNHSKLSVIRKLDFDKEIDFSIYPNPAKNELTLQFTDEENKEVAVIDMAGRVVWLKKKVKTFLLTIPLQPLSTGLYLIRITDNSGKQVVQRLMKE